MDDIKQLVNDIKNRNFKPIYFLMGQEQSYYIDKISNLIETTVLAEADRSFNQIVLYGRDVTIDDIVSNAKRYPMMAEYQVIIVKEAQDLYRSIEKLVDYAKNPQPTTILVINYKYKSIDKRKALYKNLKKTSVVYESKRLYENQVADWIKRTLSAKKYTITPKATQMLVEFLGTDLSKIANELDKLEVILPKSSQITPEVIEVNIGISKDYNNFELVKALAYGNKLKAYQIVKYFADNPKNNPIIVTLTQLFGFFSRLLHYHGLKDKSSKNVVSQLKIYPYFMDQYTSGAKNFPMRNVSVVISTLRDFDLKSKGVNANGIPQGDLLKELLAKILK